MHYVPGLFDSSLYLLKMQMISSENISRFVTGTFSKGLQTSTLTSDHEMETRDTRLLGDTREFGVDFTSQYLSDKAQMVVAMQLTIHFKHLRK